MKKISLEKYQKSRETIVSAGSFSFTVRRPTRMDVARIGANGGLVSLEFAARFVVGWSGVNEADLIPGGDPEPAEFDGALFAAWIADRSDLWKSLAEGVSNAYQQYEEATEARGNV